MAGDLPVPESLGFRELIADQRKKQQDGQRPNRLAGDLPVIDLLDSQQIGRRAKSLWRNNDLIEPLGQLGFSPHHSIQMGRRRPVGHRLIFCSLTESSYHPDSHRHVA